LLIIKISGLIFNMAKKIALGLVIAPVPFPFPMFSSRHVK